MAKSSGQKLKLLYLIKMLRENTDENHPMSTPDIIKYLENQGIHAERKSIYNDMECLADFGYDVVQVQSRLGGGYYLGSREFELPELKLLVDAVQSSRFITTKKSRELIRKLEQIAGKNDAIPAQGNRLREQRLQEQVYVLCKITHFMQKKILPRNNIKIGLSLVLDQMIRATCASYFMRKLKARGWDRILADMA